MKIYIQIIFLEIFKLPIFHFINYKLQNNIFIIDNIFHTILYNSYFLENTFSLWIFVNIKPKDIF